MLPHFASMSPLFVSILPLLEVVLSFCDPWLMASMEICVMRLSLMCAGISWHASFTFNYIQHNIMPLIWTLDWETAAHGPMVASDILES